MTNSETDRPGTFITFEGVDGSGKSTQATALADALGTAGLPVTATREPGGSPVAERIRSILLDPGITEMAWLTEVFLYLASRAEHVAAVLRPALMKGEVVICDRFLDSTLAYQGYGREDGNRDAPASVESIRRANDFGTGGLSPDLTFLLDLDPEVGLQRARDAGRGPDRLESGGIEFLRRVREGFLELARIDPDRIVVVDADRSPEEIEKQINGVACAYLRQKGQL